jgi:pimeloyl-ACP methyl ester carboxylesterase
MVHNTGSEITIGFDVDAVSTRAVRQLRLLEFSVLGAALACAVGCQTTHGVVFRPVTPNVSSGPTHVARIAVDRPAVPCADDQSTAISNALNQTQASPVNRLLRPATRNEFDGLWMLEPYQPGKIPIIFVHGLISDRSTWSNLSSELWAVPWVHARYQFWYFQYPTGEPFLRSALTLREQTRAAIARLDPHGQDAALAQTVLIGHSMGGLISKLQVTYSSTTIWDEYANRPFSGIQGQPQHLDQLRRLFFFEPQPFVKRVVFIGTPHQGAATASRVAGRIASGLVQQPADRQQMHRSLVAANPGVFGREFQRRIPTSVDLLEPDNPLLSAMARLNFAADVRIHSVVGMRAGRLGAPSDGVVPVTSARHPGASSETFINARHQQLTRDFGTLAEISRILAEHLGEVTPH